MCFRQVRASQVGQTEKGMLEIGPAQVSSSQVDAVEIGVSEVEMCEVGSTEIKAGLAMYASPLVPDFGSLLESFEVLLVCHLDHLLEDPRGTGLSMNHQ